MLVFWVQYEQEIFYFHHGHILPVGHATCQHGSLSHPLLGVWPHPHLFVYEFWSGWHFLGVEEAEKITRAYLCHFLVDFSHLGLAVFTLSQDLVRLSIILGPEYEGVAVVTADPVEIIGILIPFSVSEKLLVVSQYSLEPEFSAAQGQINILRTKKRHLLFDALKLDGVVHVFVSFEA